MVESYNLFETTPLQSLDDLNSDIVAMESLSNDLTDEDQKDGEQKRHIPCYLSKKIKADGSSSIKIILTGAFKCFISVINTILLTANENDEVHILIDAEPGPDTEYDDQYRSLLNSIRKCKGQVTTSAGFLCSMPRVALWLSGDIVTISKIGWIRLEQLPLNASRGSAANIEELTKDTIEMMREFGKFIIDRGFITKDECQQMFEQKDILSFFGDSLMKRVAHVNHVIQGQTS